MNFVAEIFNSSYSLNLMSESIGKGLRILMKAPKSANFVLLSEMSEALALTRCATANKYWVYGPSLDLWTHSM